MVMSGTEINVAHREGRGEMKYEIFQEIEQLKKEMELNPSMDDMAKRLTTKTLQMVEKRMQKL